MAVGGCLTPAFYADKGSNYVKREVFNAQSCGASVLGIAKAGAHDPLCQPARRPDGLPATPFSGRQSAAVRRARTVLSGLARGAMQDERVSPGLSTVRLLGSRWDAIRSGPPYLRL